ncbi:MAG: DUF5803 family protein [Halolamina sp.]
MVPGLSNRSAAAVALVALVLSSGCLGFVTGNEPQMERLNEAPDQSYAWNESVDAHVTVTDDANFRAVYDLNGSATIELYRRDGFGGRNPLDARALRYQYPNGTVIDAGELRERGGSIERTGDAIVVTAPDGDGRIAFTADSTPKRFSLPTYREGSYEVVLPPDRRVEFFLFGNVVPGSGEVSRSGDRTVVDWAEVTTDTVLVQFYLQRDLFVFGAILVGIVLVGLGGLGYYRLQIRKLREKRDELGLDVDVEDDDLGDGPPPGMG